MPVRASAARTWLVLACTALLSCAGCSPANGAEVTAAPDKRRGAKAIAATLADRAACGDLEDFDTAGDARWVYTCQRNDEQSYTISVFASEQTRRSWIATHAGQVYLAEYFYAVAPGSRPGRAPVSSDLDPFA